MVKVVVSAGQYETAAETVTISWTTGRGLMRRLNQLSREHAVYGDNFAGWIKADVAFASKNDKYYKNEIIGGATCCPAGGWLDLDMMSYKDLAEMAKK